jgi:predicted Zn-dependent peptidase
MPGWLTSSLASTVLLTCFKQLRSRYILNLDGTNSVQSRAAEAQRWGAKLTGRTTRGGTTYTISCLPEDASHAVALLGQLVSSPVPADSVEAARSEIIEERRALWDVVNEDVVFDFLYSAAYQQTPLQQSVAGEIADLKKATLDDVQAFKSQNYAGSNVVVAASGAFDQAQVIYFLFTTVFSLYFPNLEVVHEPELGSLTGF